MRYRSLILCMLGGAFILAGVYFCTWSIQSASLSVGAEPAATQFYEALAKVMLPLGLSNIGIGALFFIVSKK